MSALHSRPNREFRRPATLSDLSRQPKVDVTLPALPAAASQARKSLAVLRSDLPERTYEDLVILVSELVTNSVRHTGRARGDEVEDRLGDWIDRSGIRAEVADGGPGFEKFVRPSTPDQLGGWGLQIVDRLSDRWGVRRGSAPGSAVWFEIDLHPSRSTNLR